MEEKDIVVKLDQLAEFEANRDAIEEEKRNLLEDVKVPEEVEAIMSDGMNQVNEIGKKYVVLIADVRAESNTNPFREELEALRAQAQDKLNLIVIPEEIKAALAEIDRQRADVTDALRAQEAEIEQKRAALATSANLRIGMLEGQAIIEKGEVNLWVAEHTHQVYADVAQRKADIEAEFSGKKQAVAANIEKLKAEIKADTKEIGYTVEGERYQAIFVKGKKTWNAKRLDVYVEKNPDIKSCYDVGDPSVTIRAK